MESKSQLDGSSWARSPNMIVPWSTFDRESGVKLGRFAGRTADQAAEAARYFWAIRGEHHVDVGAELDR